MGKVYFFVMLFIIDFQFFNARRIENELCFPVIGDMGGLPKPPYNTAYQVRLAKLLAKVN